MATIKMINGKYNSPNSLKNTIYYINRSDATTPDLVFSNCSSNNPNEIIREMMMNKEQWNKTEGTQLHHEVISFAPGEIEPEDALTFGVEYAYRMYGTRYQYDIAVHINTDNVHIHFINNSVSIDDGKKYNSRPEVLKKKREIIDQMCRERGLVVCEKGYDYRGQKIKDHITSYDRTIYETNTNQSKKEYSWKYKMYRAVEDAKKTAVNQENLRKILNDNGYNYIVRGKNLVFFEMENEKHRMRASTMTNTFHKDYSQEEFEKCFIKNQMIDCVRNGNVILIKLTPVMEDTHWVELGQLRRHISDGLIDCLPTGQLGHDIYIAIKTIEAIVELLEIIIKLIDMDLSRCKVISAGKYQVDRSKYRKNSINLYDDFRDYKTRQQGYHRLEIENKSTKVNIPNHKFDISKSRDIDDRER